MSNRGEAARQAKHKNKSTRPPAGDAPKRSRRPNVGLILGLGLLGTIISVLLILVLVGGPDRQRESAASGGLTVVEKAPPAPVPEVPPVTAAPPALPPTPSWQPQPGAEAKPAGGPAVAPATEAPPTPGNAIAPTPAAPTAEPAPDPPPPLPQVRPAPPAPPAPQTARSEPALPWQTPPRADAPRTLPPVAAAPPRPTDGAVPRLPGNAELRSWVRSSAREFVGGVDADGMPLYRFDVWLEMPSALRPRVRLVSYQYRAPSAKPPVQSSSDAASGFRVKFGAAACAEKAVVTLVLIDGRQRQVDVDGCRILN